MSKLLGYHQLLDLIIKIFTKDVATSLLFPRNFETRADHGGLPPKSHGNRSGLRPETQLIGRGGLSE